MLKSAKINCECGGYGKCPLGLPKLKREVRCNKCNRIIYYEETVKI